VLKEKTDAWHRGVSPSSRQERLESLLHALKGLVDAGLGAALFLANLHHRRIVPLMERELHIYEMSDAANPTALARSRLLHERLPPEYAAMRARRAINVKSVRHDNNDLWSFVMLLDAPTVSRPPFSPRSLAMHRCGLDSYLLAEGDRGRRTIGSTDAPGSGGRPCRAAARTGKGGTHEGEENQTARAPGAVG
jgi:hypothetical protein